MIIINLYHATYQPLMDSIKKHGLGATKRQNYADSKQGVVYLARNPDVAMSYAETSEAVPDEWLNQIVVLKINTTQLDPNKLFIDRNVQDNDGATLEYRGVIKL